MRERGGREGGKEGGSGKGEEGKEVWSGEGGREGDVFIIYTSPLQVAIH